MQELTPLEKAKEILLYSPQQIRDVYAERPITFMRTYNPRMKWPLKIRTIFAEIWTGEAGPNVIMKGPRGGGKSELAAALGFCYFYLRGMKIVDMAGSLAQAKIVYNYFTDVIYSDGKILASLPKEPMMEMTTGMDNNYFSCVAASPKAVRGPHPDVLLADEACEIPDDLLESALPMVDSSQSPLRIITSTFHKIYGIFQDVWDRADELGYTRFSWDAFDVVRKFDASVWDDEKYNREIPDFAKLKELAGGRTGDEEGWIPITNLINAWRGKRSLDWFLTNYMGLRPSAEGLVNDPVDVDASVFELNACPQYGWVKGSECVGGLDWGYSSMTAFVALMGHADGVKVQTDCMTYTQVKSEIIIADVVRVVKERGIRVIYADSAGKFENASLKDELKKANAHCEVIEVVFSKEKGWMVGNYRAHFQRGKVRIPSNFKTAIWQHKRYRFAPGSDKPMKKDDHVPDATMCAMSHWPLGEISGTINDMMTTEGYAAPISSGLRSKKF